MNKTIVCVSPHLDDAVFSVGGLIASLTDQGHQAHVVTCFTQSVTNPKGFALACQLDKGLSADVDYMQLRREEDRTACQQLGAKPHWLDLLEAPHRGYYSAADLFNGANPQDTVPTKLQNRLSHIIKTLKPDILLLPIGIGDHIDHQQVISAVKSLQLPIHQYQWYDQPYYANNAHLKPDEAIAIQPAEWINEMSNQSRILAIDITQYTDRKIKACEAYTTQVKFQFKDNSVYAVLNQVGIHQEILVKSSSVK